MIAIATQDDSDHWQQYACPDIFDKTFLYAWGDTDKEIARFHSRHFIRVHPMALIRFQEVKDEAVRTEIEALTKNYNNKGDYFVDKLAQGIATIAAAFYPKDVIVR
jgi:hypothetical protein